MPIAIVQNDIVRITILGVANGQRVINTFHYAAIDPPFVIGDPANTLEEALGAFRTKWRAAALPLLNSNYSVLAYHASSIKGRIANPSAPPPFLEDQRGQSELAGGELDVGGAAGTPTPSFEAFGVFWVGVKPGRNFRGHTRLGPPVEESSTNNAVTIAAFTLLESFVVAMLGNLILTVGGSEMPRVNYSRTKVTTQGGVFVWPDAAISLVAAGRPSQFISTQVSRKQRSLF